MAAPGRMHGQLCKCIKALLPEVTASLHRAAAAVAGGARGRPTAFMSTLLLGTHHMQAHRTVLLCKMILSHIALYAVREAVGHCH